VVTPIEAVVHRGDSRRGFKPMRTMASLNIALRESPNMGIES
jgi:hypothetical protein